MGDGGSVVRVPDSRGAGSNVLAAVANSGQCCALHVASVHSDV